MIHSSEQKKISIADALWFGLSTTLENIGYFLGMFLSWFAVTLSSWIVIFSVNVLLVRQFAVYITENNGVMLPHSWGLFFLFLVVLLFILSCALFFQWLSVYLLLGLVKASLEFYEMRTARFSALFSQARITWKSLIATVLYTLIVAVGLCLLVVPGIVWMVQLGFFNQFIVDQRMGPIQALQASSQLTHGVKLPLIGFVFLLLLINMLGALLLGVGLIITIPTTVLATTYVYRILLALPIATTHI